VYKKSSRIKAPPHNCRSRSVRQGIVSAKQISRQLLLCLRNRRELCVGRRPAPPPRHWSTRATSHRARGDKMEHRAPHAYGCGPAMDIAIPIQVQVRGAINVYMLESHARLLPRRGTRLDTKKHLERTQAGFAIMTVGPSTVALSSRRDRLSSCGCHCIVHTRRVSPTLAWRLQFPTWPRASKRLHRCQLEAPRCTVGIVWKMPMTSSIDYQLIGQM
jgi:hypothetical protein